MSEDKVAGDTMWIETLLFLGVLMIAAVGQWMVLEQTTPFFQAFDTRSKHEWVGRVIACLFTAMIVGFAALQGSTSVWGKGVAMAYFLHDIGHMLLYESDITAYGHHIVSILTTALVQFAMTPMQADTVAVATAVLESTTPILNTTWLLNKAGYGSHPLFKYVAGFMVVFFGVMRVGVFPWLVWSRMDRASTALFSPLVGLNVYWFFKLIRLVHKKLAVSSDPDVSEKTQ